MTIHGFLSLHTDTVFSVGTSPIGVKFGRRRRRCPRSLQFWGQFPGDGKMVALNMTLD